MALSYGFALKPTDNSSDFANALRAITGDGITQYGGRFSLTSVNGFTATLSTGYVFAAGRWLENNELYRMTVQPSGNSADRTDALVCRVDYKDRKAALEILVDVDLDAIKTDPSMWRNDNEYNVFLYFIRVKRGVTSLAPSDVIDLRADGKLCGSVVPYSSIAGDVLYVYNFLLSGIDKKVARLIGLSKEVEKKADTAIAELDETLQKVSGAAQVGELITCRNPPADEDNGSWLLCDGGTVPANYPELFAILEGTLPNISTSGDKYKTYIFAGAPGA